MTLESLARTIAKARHGTDVMWPNYMEAAEAAAEWFAKQQKAMSDTQRAEVALDAILQNQMAAGYLEQCFDAIRRTGVSVALIKEGPEGVAVDMIDADKFYDSSS